ncbi:hypothetical protein WJX79_010178 [Trebouxia sp. C0005]
MATEQGIRPAEQTASWRLGAGSLLCSADLDGYTVKRTLKKPGTLLEDDWLKRVPDNIDKMVAVLPALLVASDPFQSVSSFSNAEAKEIAYDFKLRLLIYYFNQHRPRLPPGLAQGEPLPSFNMQCMISKLWLERNIIEAAHIVSNATNSSRWGDCVLGINNVWDERNGLLWAQPFAKAYHAHEIAVMYESSSGTFKFRVLTDKLISKRLSDYGKSEDAKPSLFYRLDTTQWCMRSQTMSWETLLYLVLPLSLACPYF